MDKNKVHAFIMYNVDHESSQSSKQYVMNESRIIEIFPENMVLRLITEAGKNKCAKLAF
jgi:hypothetical protein